MSAAAAALALFAAAAAVAGGVHSGHAAQRPQSRPPPVPLRLSPGPPRPDDPLLARHRQLVIDGQLASRRRPPAPRAQWQTAGNPIVQTPLATRPTAAAGVSGLQRILPIGANPPPPACPPDPNSPAPQKVAGLLIVFGNLSWHVCVRDMHRPGLWIGPVHMIRGGTGSWEKVIERAGLAEIFVPYHNVNFRPYDLKATFQLQTVEPHDLGLSGQLVQLSNEPLHPTVVAEIRDTGVALFCSPHPFGQGPSHVRFAREFVVWGVVEGGNYDNVVEYAFREDGAITFRLGNTGYNSPPNPVEPHTHNALWYIDTELTPAGPPLGESAFWLTHVEPAASATPELAADQRAPILVEGARQWDEREFASLLIEDGIANPFGNRLGFEFAPLQNALSRHFGYKESWTQNDVYVTRARAGELGWIASWDEPDDYLLTYLDNEPVVGEDLAIWIKTAAHHHPTDEDRSAADLFNAGTTGVTLMHWSGFIMRPHNLFTFNPLGGPVRCAN